MSSTYARPRVTVVRLRVVTDAGDVDGTGVLIHSDDCGSNIALYFLTSSRLFRGPDGEALPRAPPVRLWFDAEHTLDMGREDVFIPAGPVIDAVVLRATTAATRLVARTISYESPSLGEVFLVAGHDRYRIPTMIVERIRYHSTLLAIDTRKSMALRVPALPTCSHTHTHHSCPALRYRGCFRTLWWLTKAISLADFIGAPFGSWASTCSVCGWRTTHEAMPRTRLDSGIRP